MADHVDTATSIAFLGDVMLGRGVNKLIGRQSPEKFWGDLLTTLNEHDAVIANLECAITNHPFQWSQTYKVFHFGARPAAVDVLRAADIQCVNLANNHILDFDYQGLYDTLDHLDQAGIQRTGAGRNEKQAMQPAVFNIAGLRLGVIGLTDNEPPFAAEEDRPGTNHVSLSRPEPAWQRLEQSINIARKQGAEFIVLSLHWGPNMVEFPPEHFKRFAYGAIERGIDLIHGHSAHVLQGVEVFDNGLILYDTGDTLDDYAINADLRNDWSMLFSIEFHNGRMTRLNMQPLQLHYAQVNLATDYEFTQICDCMQRRCEPFGMSFQPTDYGLTIDL